mgnify:CR=1 FL=1
MILGDKAIKEYLSQGKGVIGYKEEYINPNSVDLTLNENYAIYRNSRLDCRAENEVIKLKMDDSLMLMPGLLYLATTNETLDLSPMDYEKLLCSGNAHRYKKTIGARVEGKSSLGRLGLFVHITAGWIDSGFNGSLVLELTVVQPLRIYPNMKICQIAFMESSLVDAHYGEKEGSKYQGQTGVQESKMHENFKL